MSETSPVKDVPPSTVAAVEEKKKAEESSTTAATATTSEKATAADKSATDKPNTPDTNVTDAAKPSNEDEEGLVEEEEVTTGKWNLPQVDVKAVEVVTGEEDEECIWKHRSKLFRWSNGEWKERGTGDSKLLRDKEGKTRFLLRQEKTGKIVANHYVVPQGDNCKLKPNAGSDKIYVWSVLDSADEPPEVHQFALMFGQAENAKKFKEEFEAAGEANLKVFKV